MTSDQKEIKRLRKVLELIRDSTYRSAVALRGVADDALQIRSDYRVVVDDHAEAFT